MTKKQLAELDEIMMERFEPLSIHDITLEEVLSLNEDCEVNADYERAVVNGILARNF